MLWRKENLSRIIGEIDGTLERQLRQSSLRNILFSIPLCLWYYSTSALLVYFSSFISFNISICRPGTRTSSISSYLLVSGCAYHWVNTITPQCHLTSWSLEVPIIGSAVHAGIYTDTALSVFLPYPFSSVSWVHVNVYRKKPKSMDNFKNRVFRITELILVLSSYSLNNN